MPTYDYKCPNCDKIHEEIHGIKESPDIKCPVCNTSCKRLITPSFGGFIFKGGTPSIHYKEKNIRKKRSEEMSRKQKSRYGEISPKIKPNIAGVETGSWSDAQKMAKEAGMNHESYTPWVEKEKKQKKGIII